MRMTRHLHKGWLTLLGGIALIVPFASSAIAQDLDPATVDVRLIEVTQDLDSNHTCRETVAYTSVYANVDLDPNQRLGSFYTDKQVTLTGLLDPGIAHVYGFDPSGDLLVGWVDAGNLGILEPDEASLCPTPFEN